MKSLVTGGTGFLGGALARKLLQEGEAVRVLARKDSPTAALEALGAERWTGSLEDAAAVRQAVRGMDRVYHCAAKVADFGAWAEFERTNVLGVQHVVDACLAEGVARLIHVSSTDVYGHPDAPVDEDAPHRRRGYAYGDTKLEGEMRVWEAHRRHGLPVVVLRPASIYGPGSQPFVAEIATLLEQRLMLHVGRSSKPAGLAYIDHVVDVMRLAAERDEALGLAFNVHDGLETSWETYVNLLADALKLPRPRIRLSHRSAFRLAWGIEGIWKLLRLTSKPPLTRLAIDLIGTHQGFSTARLRNRLGWQPSVPLEVGVARAAAWWQDRAARRSQG